MSSPHHISMALYHRTRIQAAPSTSGQFCCTGWSQDHSSSPTLAIALPNSGVYLFSQEGLAVAGEAGEAVVKSARGEDATVLTWNPVQRLLAVGWRDGVLSTWRAQDARTCDDTAIHKRAITCLLWNAEGTRLISGDEDGKVGVWKCDSRGRPMPITQYKEADARVTHLAFNLAAAPPPEFVDPALPTPCPPFYYGLSTPEKTTVCHADDKGHKAVAYEVDGEIASMLYYQEKGGLVVITANFTLTLHTYVNASNSWTLAAKVKLSHAADGSGLPQAIWAGNHLLAIVSAKDTAVHMFDLESDDNFVLPFSGIPVEKQKTSEIACIAFCPQSALLAAGSQDGKVYMWRYMGHMLSGKPSIHDNSHSHESMWQFLAPIGLPPPLTSLCWGLTQKLLAAVTGEGTYILSRFTIQRLVAGKRGVAQLSPNHVAVESLEGPAQTQILTTSFGVVGAHACETHLLLWGATSAEVFELANSGVRKVAAFTVPAGTAMAIIRDSVFYKNGASIEILTLQGTQKQTLLLDDALGHATHLDVCEELLVVVTENGFIKMWRVGGREAKPHGSSSGRQFQSEGQTFGKIASVRCNCNGSKVSILMEKGDTEGAMDSRLVVYDAEADTFQMYDFRPMHRRPISHFWDAEEPKLLCCEAILDTDQMRADGLDVSKEKEVHVTTLFATPDHGILYHDKVEMEEAAEGLLGLQVPYIYLFYKPKADVDGDSLAGPFHRNIVMCNFAGMENVDAKMRKALLGFSYQLSIGNMDEAYKAVKAMRSARVWESMAVMCIKTKRLDVLEHCLANMGHARAARTAREAQDEPEVEARLALVAIQLGLIEDAQKLYVSCDRPDLLNSLYQACGEWEKAVEVSEKSDRIRMRATHYAHGKHLEALGDMRGAIREYELSDNHRYEVPRMLNEWGQLEELEGYIRTRGEKELMRWWARYCEAQGNIAKALQCYEWAGDWLPLVRIHCFHGRLDIAREIADRSGDAAAAFHLARQFEVQEKVPLAIQYFTKAERFNHAVRLAKKCGMDSDVLSLALQSSPPLMLSSAKYFEAKGMFEEAVLLFHKGGNVSRAVEICFQAQLFDALRDISDRLGDDTDPALLTKCGEFFLQHGQYEKAVHLFVIAKKFSRALDLCMDKGITITDEMAEAMTPKGAEKKSEEGLQLLRRVAKCCHDQGSFHLSCKKFTQAGDKIKAMKVLLKSGDTEKIIFFANVSRHRDIYVLAANYLQSLDWHSDLDVMKSIIQFYTKASAMGALAAFYEACAQIEIDEYRDYEKALGALKEALKHLNKARSEDREGRLTPLQRRITMVERFVQARGLVKSEPTEMIRLCNELLLLIPFDQSDIESVVRVGDVYALLVEYYHSKGDMEQAYAMLEAMRDRNIILSPYLNHNMVQHICQSMGEVSMQDAGDEDHIHEEISNEQ